MEILSGLPVGVMLAIILPIILISLASGIPIGLALGLVGIFTMVLFTRFDPSITVPLLTWNRASFYTLASLPMFILAGEILVNTRLGRWLFDGLSPLLPWLPGRLYHTTIAGCTIFAGVTGSTLATVVTIGKVTYHELSLRGYNKDFAAGTLTVAGTLGILIPPSIVPILYASVVQVSMGRIFIAGIFPGLLMAGLFVLYIVFRVKLNPHLMPSKTREQYTWHDSLRGILLVSPTVVFMTIILGALYTGLATVTEIAGLSVVLAFTIGFVSKTLGRKEIVASLLNTSRTVSFIFFIIIGASFLGQAMAYLRVPALVTMFVASITDNPYMVILMLTVPYIILGMFLDPNSIVLMTVPVIISTVDMFGIDRVWFGIYLILMLQMANVTPPVGFNLFVVRDLTGVSIDRIFKEALPFLIIIVVVLLIIMLFPAIALWLPSMMIGG